MAARSAGACAWRAVRLTRQALDATPAQDREYLGRLLNFVVASATLARLNRDPAVLDDPLRRCRRLHGPGGRRTPDTLLEPGHAYALACRHELTGDADAATAAIEAYQRGAADTRLSVFRRLDAAHAGAKLAARCGETGPGLELYALAIDLLDSAAWRGIDRRDQERLLAQYAGLPSDAAAIAITAGRPETAVEFLERGRGVLLDRLLDDSADLARLNEITPALAAQFGELRSALDDIVMPDPEATDFEMPLRPPEQDSEADQRSALARQLDHLISEIRALPGCDDLFRSPELPGPARGDRQRSVAVINISAYRCDALTVTPDGVTITPLPDLTQQDAERAAEFFRTRARESSAARSWPARRRVMNSQLGSRGCGTPWPSPSLRDIGMTDAASAGAEVPRLYWCPTGPAAFLPLHAAGHHGEASPSAPADGHRPHRVRLHPQAPRPVAPHGPTRPSARRRASRP